MKIKVSKGELKECVRNAVVRVINESKNNKKPFGKNDSFDKPTKHEKAKKNKLNTKTSKGNKGNQRWEDYDDQDMY